MEVKKNMYISILYIIIVTNVSSSIKAHLDNVSFFTQSDNSEKNLKFNLLCLYSRY